MADLGSIEAIADRQPDLVIHAAAMTRVDGCARDPDRARRINAGGTRNVALACQRRDVPLVYISSNEVFDGRATAPYAELDATGPINAYGRTKLEGERYVQLLLRRFYIVRTAWVFGPAGRSGASGTNFVTKMLQLGQGGQTLRLVTDEISSPTYAPDLAEAIGRLIETGIYGIHHLTNQGICSRYEYARAIFDRAGLADLPLEPIRLAEFARPSTPPPYTALANLCAADLGIVLRPWQDALDAYLASGALELVA